MPVGPSHYFIRGVAAKALAGFFKEVHVIGEENVPKDGPVIVCCTHHNMMIDPAVLSSTMAYGRPLHYWAKASLFKHPIARKVLLSSGVIPVERGSHDNQKLFAGTFDALAQGDAVALFPEGTSYTLPRIVQVKDGASWSALEFLKWVSLGNKTVNNGKELVIVPAGITYTDKSKYRSSAVIEYGPPIRLSEFKQRFLSGSDTEARAAVKALTHAIEKAMIELTVNAPNWEVLLAARTARDLLFESWRNVPLDSFKDVYQTLVDVFSTPWDSDSEFVALKRSLITYYSLLKTTHLTNGELANLPLSQSRKASSESPVPSRLSTILPLLRESIAVLIRLPLFLVPLMINLPIYWTTRWAGEKASVDEESIAQSKVVVGLILFIAIHGFWFWIIWMCLAVTPIGALIAGASVWGLATYHQKLIDDNYLRAKRLLSAYRVLVGVWGPQRWDLSLSALTQYTTTQPPPENPFLKLPESVKNALVRSSSSPTAPTLASIDAAAPTPTPMGAPKVKRSQRPPSRKLIRHLFRARADAIRRLAAFIRKLDDPSVRVCASGFMARSFNPDPNGVRESLFDKVPGGTNAIETVQGGVETELNPTGWRSGKEVITYLRLKGAKVGKVLREGEGGEQAVQWDAVAAMGSEAELSSPGSGDEQVRIKQEEVEWVIPGSNK